MFLFLELLEDDACTYGLLAYGGWHFFGPQIMQEVLSTDAGRMAYSMVQSLFA